MKHFCRNCEIEFEGNYCNRCGQNAKTFDINFKNFMHDVTHLLHFEKGLFYTIKELIVRPGITIRNYITGKRVNHIKPLTMLILLAGIFGFMYHYMGIDIKDLSISVQSNGSNAEQESVNKEIMGILQEWMTKKQSLINLFLAIIWTFSTVIVFRKAGYNFFEHIVINTFSVSQKLAITIISFPVLFYACKGNPTLFSNLSLLVETFLTFRIYMFFYNQYSWKKRFWLTLLATILFYFLYIMILSLISFGYLMTTKPELFKG